MRYWRIVQQEQVREPHTGLEGAPALLADRLLYLLTYSDKSSSWEVVPFSLQRQKDAASALFLLTVSSFMLEVSLPSPF